MNDANLGRLKTMANNNKWCGRSIV